MSNSNQPNPFDPTLSNQIHCGIYSAQLGLHGIIKQFATTIVLPPQPNVQLLSTFIQKATNPPVSFAPLQGPRRTTVKLNISSQAITNLQDTNRCLLLP